MQQMGLQAIYPKPRLSVPGQGHRIYPYLLRDIKIDGAMLTIATVWRATTKSITRPGRRKGTICFVTLPLRVPGASGAVGVSSNGSDEDPGESSPEIHGHHSLGEAMWAKGEQVCSLFGESEEEGAVFLWQSRPRSPRLEAVGLGLILHQLL